MFIIDQAEEHEPSLREYLSQVLCGNRWTSGLLERKQSYLIICVSVKTQTQNW